MSSRILIVDDDPSVASSLGGVLLSEGYEVAYAANGSEAIDGFSHNDPIDLVLLDLCMPVKGGWDTFEALTSIDPVLPIVVITARSDQYPLAQAAGVAGLMEKPLNIPLLLEMMQQLLAEGITKRLARIAVQSPSTLYPDSINWPQQKTS